MPMWQVAVMLNLVLAMAVGVGYAGWGRRAAALDRELDAARVQAERLERERQACTGGAHAGEQQWDGRGVVRAVYPQLLIITHEEIRGLLPARTTGFPRTPSTLASVRLGDAVRFSLRGTAPDDATLVAITP